MKRLDCKLLRTLHKAACPRCLSITGTLLQNDLTELPRVLEYVGPQLSIHDDADQQPPREAVAALSRRWGLRVSEQRIRVRQWRPSQGPGDCESVSKERRKVATI
uniref:Putative helicase-like protein n=1 Tax=Leishmania guyanensis TaxID=5670 RepID=A0A1E1J330_LEIGU|nr:Putative helicase-like protein [Leishmania guyanensis]